MSDPIRVIVIGAHPDEPDVYAGGTAALFAEMGHKVKFLSLTNGDAGHSRMKGKELSERRAREAQEAAKHLGIEEYEILDNHDGALMSTLELRQEVIRRIRNWKADVVIAFHPDGCTHTDNRYAGRIVADASAFVAKVPNIVPDTPSLDKAPLFLLMPDYSMRNRYRADIVVDIGPALEKKLLACDAHATQFYEFAPHEKEMNDTIPQDWEGKREFLLRGWAAFMDVSDEMKQALRQGYGSSRAEAIRYAEPFEYASYNVGPLTDERRLALFPMIRSNS
ncbi:PIG-L deacetylase family protein [Cohnella soli]|uniref:PIG-L deacetylase family protein n=1 Tax=Cohnella soli TaxID=425005 RepID=A0ABW0I412_9BACL